MGMALLMLTLYQQRKMVLVTGKVRSGGRNPDDKTMITDGRSNCSWVQFKYNRPTWCQLINAVPPHCHPDSLPTGLKLKRKHLFANRQVLKLKTR